MRDGALPRYGRRKNGQLAKIGEKRCLYTETELKLDSKNVTLTQFGGRDECVMIFVFVFSF